MLTPAKCATCHPRHFTDWTNSMHAQASDDPVFIAMNKRGQRETNGQLGAFCVKCHAPMAVRDGMTTDGLNLASLPQYYKGVTCFFCHTINSVDSSHNNASVNLSGDLVMRAELQHPPPVANSAHSSTYSTFHDDGQRDSATMCGSCHDIVSPAGGHIERTFQEWSGSAYAENGGLTCSTGGCHMTADPVQAPIAPGGPARLYHPHDFPAVDVSLETSMAHATSLPVTLDGGAADGASSAEAGGSDSDGGLSTEDAGPTDAGGSTEDGAPAIVGNAVPPEGGLPGAVEVQNALNNNALQGALCVTANSAIRVILDTSGVGHHWPSGAAQDRRAWAEVVAYGANGETYSSGVVPDGTPVTSIHDPDLWLMRDCMFNAQKQRVDNFWEAAETGGYELPVLLTTNKADLRYFANHVIQAFPGGATAPTILPFRPVRVTLRIRVQPIGLDVLQDLVSTGDLDPSIVAKMPTFDVSLQGPLVPGLTTPGGLEWTPSSNDVPGWTDIFGFGPATCAATMGFNIGVPVPAGSAATCSL
jgi:hypothetical protein